jgi:hypothetical protein
MQTRPSKGEILRVVNDHRARWPKGLRGRAWSDALP